MCLCVRVREKETSSYQVYIYKKREKKDLEGKNCSDENRSNIRFIIFYKFKVFRKTKAMEEEKGIYINIFSLNLYI